MSTSNRKAAPAMTALAPCQWAFGTALAFSMAWWGPAAATAQEIGPSSPAPRAGREMSVSLGSGGDSTSGALSPGGSLTIDVSVHERATDEPVRGLHVAGFIRRIGTRSSSCAEAVRGYRATGRVRIDDVDLSAASLIAVMDGRRLAAVDVSQSLASANIRWLAPLDGDIAQVIVLSAARTIAATHGNELDGMRLSLVDAGDGRPLEGLATATPVRRIALEPGSTDRLVALDQDARTMRRIDPRAPSRKASFVSPGTVTAFAPTPDGSAIALSDGRLIWFDWRQGPETASRHSDVVPPDDLAYAPKADAVLALYGDRLALIAGDDRSAASDIKLLGPARRLRVMLGGALVVAWNDETGLVNVVDLASRKVLPSLHFPGGVSDVADTRDFAAFLMKPERLPSSSEPQVAAALVGLGPMTRGEQVSVTRVALPSSAVEARLASVGPDGPLLAAAAAPGAVHVLPHEAGMRAPVNAIPIRGGRLDGVFPFVQGFREDAPGAYRTSVRLPQAGRFEVVITTGVGGLTQCLPLTVGTPEDTGSADMLSARLLVDPSPTLKGPASSVRFELHGPGAAVRGFAEVTVLSPATNWFQRFDAVIADGRGSVSFTPPFAGDYLISARLRAGGKTIERSELIQVKP